MKPKEVLVPSSSNNTQLTLFCTVIMLKWPVIFCSMFILSRLQLLINVNKLIHLNNLTEHKHQSMQQQILTFVPQICAQRDTAHVLANLSAFFVLTCQWVGLVNRVCQRLGKKNINLNHYVLPQEKRTRSCWEGSLQGSQTARFLHSSFQELLNMNTEYSLGPNRLLYHSGLLLEKMLPADY